MFGKLLSGIFTSWGLGIEKSEVAGASVQVTAGAQLNRFIDYESYLVAGLNKIWATFAACDIKAKTIMDQPWGVYRTGGQEPVEVKGLTDLLRVPNQFYTFSDLIYESVMHHCLTGSSFIFKVANGPGGKPVELWPLNPKRVKIFVTTSGMLAGYVYTNEQGIQVPMELDEVIHIRRPHPNKMWWGLGDMEAAEPLFNNFLNRAQWEDQVWRNGATPSGVMTNKDWTGDQKELDRLKEKFKREYQGTENAGKVAFVTGAWEYEKIGMTAEEMQNVENSKWTVDQIFSQHGVPLSVAGLRDSANYATAEIDRVRFRTMTVKPLLSWYEQTLTSDLAAMFGAYEFRFTKQGLVAVGEVAEAYTPLFDRGVLSVNELREAIGLARKDDPVFDQHFMNAGLVPLDLAGVAAPDQTGRQAQEQVSRFLTSHVGKNGER